MAAYKAALERQDPDYRRLSELAFEQKRFVVVDRNIRPEHEILIEQYQILRQADDEIQECLADGYYLEREASYGDDGDMYGDYRVGYDGRSHAARRKLEDARKRKKNAIKAIRAALTALYAGGDA